MVNEENWRKFEEYINEKNSKKSIVINNLLYFFYNTSETYKKNFLNDNDDNSTHNKPVGLFIKNNDLFNEAKKYGFTQVINILIYYFINADEDIKKTFLKKYI